ncbi:MAG: hypothetical protein JKY56_06425 [Kofleriaceae bacterium]|nr:hypothetical protein [Kofleriaceae bacterium]
MKNKALTFDDQIGVLATAGIRPREGTPRDRLLFNYDESDWLNSQWECLFDLVEHSDDIEDLALKCLEDPIEDADVYARILRRLVELCKGLVPLKSIESVADFEHRLASATFTLEEETLRWDFEWNESWVDMSVFSRFGALLKNRSNRALYVLQDDPRNEGIMVVSLTVEEKTILAEAGARVTAIED